MKIFYYYYTSYYTNCSTFQRKLRVSQYFYPTIYLVCGYVIQQWFLLRKCNVRFRFHASYVTSKRDTQRRRRVQSATFTFRYAYTPGKHENPRLVSRNETIASQW